MLCRRCERFTLDVWNQDFTSWMCDDSGFTVIFEYAHGSYHDMVDAQAAGCDFCAFFLPTFADWLGNPHRLVAKMRFMLSKARPSRSSYTFKMEVVEDRERWAKNFTNFEVFYVPTLGPRQIMNRPPRLQIPCQLSPRSDSPWCIELIKHWVEQCRNSHATCVRASESILPTRVIDVRPRDPKLLIPAPGTHGDYVTLSYCWGKIGNVTTSKENIGQNQSSIDMQSLPKTIRDAIDITRLLSFSYLWIDALCIIQDDAEDWAREASKMCSVYEMGTLSLAALEAEASTAGFLHDRDRQYKLSRAREIEIGIRSPLRDAQSVLPGTPLESRAWTLQERILAPAVVHFASDQIYWECGAGFACETRPWVQQMASGANDSYYERSVHEMKIMLHRQPQWQNPDLWNELLATYTQRALTKASDRLPALQGLATKFAAHSDAEYLFGIWSDAIHTGLLWSVTAGATLPGEASRSLSVPSWSWASLEAPIQFLTRLRSHYGHKVIPRATISLLSVAECRRRIRVPGSLAAPLVIVGKCQAGLCIKSSKNRTNCDFVTPTSSRMLVRINCTMDYIDGNVRVRQPVPGSFHCLLVAETQNDSPNAATLLYLILEDAQGHGETDSEAGIYRRVGVGHQDVLFGSGRETCILAGIDDREILLI